MEQEYLATEHRYYLRAVREFEFLASRIESNYFSGAKLMLATDAC